MRHPLQSVDRSKKEKDTTVNHSTTGLALTLAILAACSSTATGSMSNPAPETDAATQTDTARPDANAADTAISDNGRPDVATRDTRMIAEDAGSDADQDAAEASDANSREGAAPDVTADAFVSDAAVDVPTADTVTDAISACGTSQLWTRAVNFREGDPLPADTDEYEVSFRGMDRWYPTFSMIYVVVYEEYMGRFGLRTLTLERDRDLHPFASEGPWLECEYAAGRTATFRYRFRVQRGNVAGIVFAFQSRETGTDGRVNMAYNICNVDRDMWPIEIRRVGNPGLLRVTNFNETRHYPGTVCYGLIEGSPCPPDAMRQPDGSCRL